MMCHVSLFPAMSIGKHLVNLYLLDLVSLIIYWLIIGEERDSRNLDKGSEK